MDNSIFKMLWWIVSNRIRYPRLKKRSMYLSEPNLIYGLTDHPLDVNGSSIFEIFTVIRKFLARTPISILRINLKDQQENRFRFVAKGFDILHKRNINIDHVEYFTDITDPKVKFTECTLQLDFLNETTYRLRLSMGTEISEHKTPMVYADISEKNLKTELEETEEKYIISTSALQVHIFKNDFRIQIRDSQNHIITESGSRTHNEFYTATDAFPLGFVKNRKPKRMYSVENFNIYPDESIFGLGEKFGPLNRVGQTISLWNIEGIGNTSGRAYKHIPFYLSSRGYGVFFNHFNPMTFWVGTRELSKIEVAIENTKNALLDYYFFYGPTPKNVLTNYSALTGRSPVPPRWSYGVWMSRLSYNSQQEVLEVANKIRAEKFPCDVIHIDTNWFEEFWGCDWKFDPKRFPDPESMFRQCADLGFKISLWQAPYVKDSLPLYKEGKNQKVFAKNHGPFMFLNFGPHHVIDFSNPKATLWYQEKLSNLFKQGAKVIKVDFGEQIEPHQEFQHYTGREMHNLFPLLYNQAAFEVTEKELGKGNALIWARSAYAGSQRYPVHWSGDNSSTFPNMLCSLRGGLSLGLASFTFWSQDVGGFVGIPDDLLYVRWVALSIFQSHFRFHGCAPKFREPWNFSPEAQEIVRGLLEFRYQLVPYLYSESIQAVKRGLPLISPLFLEFPDDPMCYHIEDQFLSGRNLLVAPILTEESSRRIYIPSGQWYDYWSGELHTGPRWLTVEDIPLDQIPLFVRSGSILPLGEKCQYISENLPTKLIVLAYPDSEGVVSYILRDEIGSIQFTGTLEAEILQFSISLDPSDRDAPHIEIKTPPGLSYHN